MPNNIIRLEQDNADRIYVQPDPAAPESERDAIWYADNIKYGCSFYDIWYNTLISNGRIGSNVGANSNGSTGSNGSNINLISGGMYQETPSLHMIRMMSYYNGNQPNLDYNHLTQNVQTTNLMPSWIKSEKVYSIVNVMKDIMDQMLQNMDFDVDNLSDDAVSEKKELLDKLMVQYELRPILEQLARAGTVIDSSGGKNFEFPEEIKKHVDQIKDLDSLNCIRLARYLWSSCALKEKFLQAFQHIKTAGRCGMEALVVNGRLHPEIYMPYELIVDPRVDDPYNRQAQFVGKVKYYTPNQLFTLFPQTLQYKKEILHMAQESSAGTPFNTMNNLTWWYYGGWQQRGCVGTVTLYWKTLRQLDKAKKLSGKNVVKYAPTREGEGKMEWEDVCMGTLAGNSFLLNYGYADNVQEDVYNKSKTVFPIHIFMPDMNLGISKSTTARIADLVNERDAMRLRIREEIASSVGKAYFVKTWKFGNSANMKEMWQDLKSMRVHALTHSGEEPEVWRDDEGNVLEQMDLTMDPNVLRLYEVIQSIDTEILEIAKVSQTALGNDQVQKYMGAGVQQNAMDSGSGNSTTYTGFIHYIQGFMQYAVNCLKYLYTEDDSDYPQMILGKRGFEFLKLSKKMRYSNPLLSLVVAPFINAPQKNRLLVAADRALAAGAIGFEDYIEVEMASNLVDLNNKIKYGIKKRKAEAEQAAAAQQMIDSVNQQNAATQQQILQQGKVAGQKAIQDSKQENEMGMQVLDHLMTNATQQPASP